LSVSEGPLGRTVEFPIARDNVHPLHERFDVFSAPVIPSLALGLTLSSPFLPSEQLDSFMRRMLISRISRRVIAEHHIALSSSFAGNTTELPEEPDVGIIFTGLNVKRSVEKCATLLSALLLDVQDDDGKILDSTAGPQVIVDGHTETRFPYIREHLEYVRTIPRSSYSSWPIMDRYIVFELLKNVCCFALCRSICSHRDLVDACHTYEASA
jgi:hypothetical protein